MQRAQESLRAEREKRELQSRVADLRHDFKETAEDTYSITAEMTRQYKAMEERFMEDINRLEGEISTLRDELAEARAAYEELQAEKDAALRAKDEEIAALKEKASRMAEEFGDMLQVRRCRRVVLRGGRQGRRADRRERKEKRRGERGGWRRSPHSVPRGFCAFVGAQVTLQKMADKIEISAAKWGACSRRGRPHRATLPFEDPIIAHVRPFSLRRGRFLGARAAPDDGVRCQQALSCGGGREECGSRGLSVRVCGESGLHRADRPHFPHLRADAPHERSLSRRRNPSLSTQ